MAIPVDKIKPTLTKLEKKALIRKASEAVNKQYSEAFKMISKN